MHREQDVEEEDEQGDHGREGQLGALELGRGSSWISCTHDEPRGIEVFEAGQGKEREGWGKVVVGQR
jgi:hypothetical protein